HEVLNAKNHEREALIIAEAGQRGAVTLSTNMAGRGVDILLGPGVVDLGGLHVIGTERHEARRIDNQLRGRAGRQGDPGTTRFFNSLEDDLIRIFASEGIAGMLGKLGMNDAQPIESRMVTGAITQAQIKVETRNFDMRKRALEFDDVLNNQRNEIYKDRRKILEKGDVRETVLDFLHDEASAIVDAEATSPDPEDWDLHKLAAGVAQTVLRVSVRTAEQAEQTEQQQGSPPQQTSTSGNGTTSTGRADLRTNRDDTMPTTSTGKKLGRNDPCWCGSGKKFKKCHG